jgi:hypothetical protein
MNGQTDEEKIAAAEVEIRTILLELEDATGKSVWDVVIDTRNSGGLKTEISLMDTPRQ